MFEGDPVFLKMSSSICIGIWGSFFFFVCLFLMQVLDTYPHFIPWRLPNFNCSFFLKRGKILLNLSHLVEF